MFLNRLDTQSKQVFLKIAHHVARSDDSFMDIQKALIAGYCAEMDIDDVEFDENNFSLEDTLKEIVNSDMQKIILMEVLAIVYADSIMHPAEKEIIDIMVDTWDINSNLVIVYGEWSKSLLSLSIQGEALLDLN
ncbi:MAG: TerB family tellurite resistance protein [Campylobacterota bacterium]|nr:TerB family tellurite resistance protein [Campylobacterota bacterium]